MGWGLARIWWWTGGWWRVKGLCGDGAGDGVRGASEQAGTVVGRGSRDLDGGKIFCGAKATPWGCSAATRLRFAEAQRDSDPGGLADGFESGVVNSLAAGRAWIDALRLATPGRPAPPRRRC